MNLLGGYGSGSDDDVEEEVKQVEIKIPVKIAPKVVVKPVFKNVNNNTSEKKVKKLDISFLPPEIADALARGATYDSDDDDIYTSKKSAAPKASKPSNVSSDFSSQLLSLLPAPKETNPKDLTPSYFPPSAPVNKESESVKPTESKSKFNFSYSEATTTTTSLKAVPESSVAATNQPVLKPRVSTYVSPFYKPTNLSNLPIDSFTSSTDTSTPGPIPAPTTNASGNYQNLQHNYAPAVQYSNNHSSYQQDDEEDEYSSLNDKHKRKKRDREIEHQLMAGDLSGINNAAISDVKADTMWNSEKYNEQQQREAQIAAQFGGGGKVGGIAQPNKLQNRKHQLNSLALRAAETELAMMDAKGNRLKSKSETQGKYGW